jgi:AraC-like DNA-binding protein
MRGVSIERLQISASMMKGLPEFTGSLGLNFENIAETAGLANVDTDNDFEYVSLDSFAQFLEIASIISGDETFGLRFAGARSTEPTGPLSFALVNAPDVRTALLTIVKYLPTRVDVGHADLIIDGERLTMDWGFSPLLVRRWQFCDYAVAYLARRVMLLADSRWRPVSVGLARPRPRDLEPFRRAFGRSIEFSQPTNSIVFPIAIGATPNYEANPAIFDMSCRLLDRMLMERKPVPDLTTRVREEIVIALPMEKGPQIQRVARRLAVSTRSLQRHLSDRGTTFQQLVDDTRMTLARRYLEDSSITLSQIAYQLGYSAPSAFTRAAHRWFGLRPGAVRRSMKAGRRSGGVPKASKLTKIN